MRYLAYMFLVTSGMMFGCGESGKAKQPFKAKIITSNNGSYELRDVEYSTLEDLDTMRGTYARIFGGASLDLNADAEHIITSEDPNKIYKDTGKSVELDYYMDGDVAIPRTSETMEMLGLYYVFEQTVSFWVQHFSIQPKQFRLFYNPSLAASGDGLDVNLKVRLNAAFMPGPRDFFLFETSSLIEEIPVKMNFGIIAHEFGHAIFDEAFANKNPSVYKSDREESDEQLSGMNEGIADFFSYMVTGNEGEFAQSIPFLDKERTLPVGWQYANLEEQPCKDSFYCKGSILASSLYQVATTGGVGALAVGKHVFAALSKFRSDWQAHKNSADFDYDYLLNRIIGEAEAEQENAYCDAFKFWFNLPEFVEKLDCD